MGREGSRQSGVDKGRVRARLYARLGRRRRPRAGGIVHGGIGSPGASRSVSMTEFPPVLRVTGPRGADSGPGGSGPRHPTSGLRSGNPPSLRRSGVRRHHRLFLGFPGRSERTAPSAAVEQSAPLPRRALAAPPSGPAAAPRSPRPALPEAGAGRLPPLPAPSGPTPDGLSGLLPHPRCSAARPPRAWRSGAWEG